MDELITNEVSGAFIGVRQSEYANVFNLRRRLEAVPSVDAIGKIFGSFQYVLDPADYRQAQEQQEQQQQEGI